MNTERDSKSKRERVRVCFSTFSPLVSIKICANLGNPSMSPWFGASFGGDSEQWWTTAGSQGARVELHRLRREQLLRQSSLQRLQGIRWEASAIRQQRTAANAAAAKARERQWKEDESRNTRKTSSSRQDDRCNGVQRAHTMEYKKWKRTQRIFEEAQQTTDPWHPTSSPTKIAGKREGSKLQKKNWKLQGILWN